jgi:glutathione S-transferase
LSEELVFYTNPHSRGRIVRWMLEEVGEPYATHIVEYGEQMKSPQYLAINPMGKVPAITHRGAVVTECAAICAYLADAFPEARLAPPLADRARYYRWLFFAAGPLEAASIDKQLGVTVPDDQQAMSGYGSFAQTVDALETALSACTFIAGNEFSAADVYVGSEISWGLQFGILEKRDAFVDYAARATDRDAYRRANEIDGPMD